MEMEIQLVIKRLDLDISRKETILDRESTIQWL